MLAIWPPVRMLESDEVSISENQNRVKSNSEKQNLFLLAAGLAGHR